MIAGIDASQDLIVTPQGAETTVLLCHFNGSNGATSSTDSSASAHALTFTGSAQLETASKKFGSAALDVGTTGIVTMPFSSDFAFTRQFTIEMWIKAKTSLSQLGQILTFGTTSLSHIAWQLIFVGGELEFQISPDGSSFPTAAVTSGGFTAADTFYGFAIDRDESGFIRIYKEGVMLAKEFRPEPIWAHPTSGLLFFGGNQSGAGFEIDECRVTKYAARYASDGGYTITTSEFSS